MGTARTSNKDILDAILGLTSAITQTHVAAPVAAPVVTPVVEADPEPESASQVEIPKGYRTHMLAKVQAKVNTDAADRIMYARRNLNGEVKLAYCLASRWTGLKDRGLIGAIAHIKPE